jgi:hypothetical protein
MKILQLFFIHLNKGEQENRRRTKVIFFKVYNQVEMLLTKKFGFYFLVLVFGFSLSNE